VRAANPDVILQSGMTPRRWPWFKGLKDLKIAPKLFASTGRSRHPRVRQGGGGDGDFTVTPVQWSGPVGARAKVSTFLSNADYIAAFHRKYRARLWARTRPTRSPTAPPPASRWGRHREGGSLDPNKVRDALASLDLQTFFGEIKFSANGINQNHPLAVVQVQQGKHVTVWPKDVANGTVQYPMPDWASR